MMIIVYSNFEHFSDWLSAFLLLEFKIFQKFHLTLFLFTSTERLQEILLFLKHKVLLKILQHTWSIIVPVLSSLLTS